MEAPRWLLPFTHGVDMRAIDYVVRLAESAGATLVAVSLVSSPRKPGSRGARLEHIQQSKDFLEAIEWKAARYEVPVERHEVFTADVIQSITMLTGEMHCDEIILATGREREVLLLAHQIKRLLIEPPVSLVLIRLSAHSTPTPIPHLGTRFLSWLQRLWGQRDAAWPVQDALAVEEPLWVRTEEYRT